MDARTRAGMTRRAAMTAAIGGAALAGAGLGMAASPARAQQRAISSGGGIAGGGLVEGPDASVHFSLFATRLPLGEEGEVVISGRVQLADLLTGVRMESVEVAEYGPIEGDDENARRLRGTMRVTTADGEAEHPFVLRAADLGGPGEAVDEFTLSVGAAAGTPESGAESGAGAADEFSYELNGTVSAGDITLVEIALAEE